MNRTVIIFTFLFLLSACASLYKASLGYKSSAFLVKKCQANDLEYDWFSAKMSGTVFFDAKPMPLNANIRMKKDSVIWISASAFLGIEAARLLLTPDSFKMINRLNSTYISSDISSLKKQFGIDLSFKQLQNRLLGDLDLEQSDWEVSSDSAHYFLTNNNSNAKINPLYFGVEWSQSKQKNSSISLFYSNFTKFNQGYLAQKVGLVLKNKNSEIKLNYNYSKVVLNKKKKIKFIIPTQYEPVL